MKNFKTNNLIQIGFKLNNVTHRFTVFWPTGQLSSRVHITKPGDGLIPLFAPLSLLDFNQFFGCVGWQQAPSEIK